MTRTMAPRLRPPWTLLGCSLAMAALVAFESVHFSAASSAPATPAAATNPPPAATRLQSFAAPTADRYAVIAERPLFIPGRRPQQDLPPARVAPPPTPPALSVQGVVITADRRYAVVQHGNPPRLDSVAEGENVDGWIVQSIDAARVQLRSGTESVNYPIGKPGPGMAPPRRGAEPSDDQ